MVIPAINNISIGNKVTLELKESPMAKRVMVKKGTVIGIYANYFALKIGKYRECFLWTDVCNGTIKIKI